MLEDANLLDEDYENGSEDRTWSTKLKIDGNVYATSLFWQPLQNSADYMQEVEDASLSVLEGADLFCIKGGKAPQFGICVSHEGYKNGETVAAIALTSALQDISSFVAVFKTDNGWWYTCIRNDIILSDGDMLFLSEEEAKNQFMSMLAVPDWGKKIAPKEWGIEETEDVDLSELLKRGNIAKLQKIHGLRGSKLVIVVAISILVGLWILSNVIDKILFTPVQRPIVVPIRPKNIQKVEVKPQPKPWERIKDPTAIMNGCYEGIKRLVEILPPGWKISDVNCSNNVISTSWHREIGNMQWMESALKDAGITSGYSFDGTGTTLSLSINMDDVKILSSAPEFSYIELRDKINNEFQTLGLPINLGTTEVRVTIPQPIQQGPGPKAAVKEEIYRAITFSISSQHDPLIWNDMLIKYSGLDIKVIKYNPSNNVWNYEGIIYVL